MVLFFEPGIVPLICASWNFIWSAGVFVSLVMRRHGAG